MGEFFADKEIVIIMIISSGYTNISCSSPDYTLNELYSTVRNYILIKE